MVLIIGDSKECGCCDKHSFASLELYGPDDQEGLPTQVHVCLACMKEAVKVLKASTVADMEDA